MALTPPCLSTGFTERYGPCIMQEAHPLPCCGRTPTNPYAGPKTPTDQLPVSTVALDPSSLSTSPSPTMPLSLTRPQAPPSRP